MELTKKQEKMLKKSSTINANKHLAYAMWFWTAGFIGILSLNWHNESPDSREIYITLMLSFALLLIGFQKKIESDFYAIIQKLNENQKS